MLFFYKSKRQKIAGALKKIVDKINQKIDNIIENRIVKRFVGVRKNVLQT